MLLLSELEDSIDMISRVLENISTKEEWLEEKSDYLADFISRHARVIFSYTGMGVIPAKSIFLSLSILAPEKEYYLKSASHLAYHYLPYIDDAGGVVLLVGSAWERSELLRTMDALNIMNTDYVVVVPYKPDDLTIKKIEKDRSLIPPSAMGISEYVYLALKTAIKSAAKITGRTDMRMKRLIEEVKSLSGLQEYLEPIYRDVSSFIHDILSSKQPVAILYSPSMEAPALLLQYLLLRQGVLSVAMDFSVAPAENLDKFRVLAMYTGVEIDLFKEVNFRLIKQGVKPYYVKSDFDPVTNQLYVLIAVDSVLRTVLKET